MSIHPVALFCTAILGLLLFGLGLVVSVSRFLHTTGSGCLPDPTDRLHKVVRAHGNTAEYAPFLAVLFLNPRTPTNKGLSAVYPEKYPRRYPHSPTLWRALFFGWQGILPREKHKSVGGLEGSGLCICFN